MSAAEMKARLAANRDELRIGRAKAEQDYDPDPPRCASCVYFRTEPKKRYAERETRNGRTGKVRIVQVRLRANPIRNPLIDRCTFGNFITKPAAVCDEWRNKAGERIEQEAST